MLPTRTLQHAQSLPSISLFYACCSIFHTLVHVSMLQRSLEGPSGMSIYSCAC